MALANTNHVEHGFSVTSIFAGIGRAMVRIAEAQPLVIEMEKLNKTSDEDFTARGTTRDKAIQKLFQSRFYI